jgi:hypothetical protein
VTAGGSSENVCADRLSADLTPAAATVVVEVGADVAFVVVVDLVVEVVVGVVVVVVG